MNFLHNIYLFILPVLSFVFGHGDLNESVKYQYIDFALATAIWAGIIILIDFARCVVFKRTSFLNFGYANWSVLFAITLWLIGSGAVSLLFCKLGLIKTTNISAITVAASWMVMFSKEIKNLLKGKPPKQGTKSGTRI